MVYAASNIGSYKLNCRKLGTLTGTGKNPSFLILEVERDYAVVGGVSVTSSSRHCKK